jgi:hypothetical protein
MTINVNEREFELIIKALNKLNTQETDDLIDRLEDDKIVAFIKAQANR